MSDFSRDGKVLFDHFCMFNLHPTRGGDGDGDEHSMYGWVVDILSHATATTKPFLST